MTSEELRAKYPKGRRVVATARYRAAFAFPVPRADGPTGVVVGYGRRRLITRGEGLIRVLRDGLSHPKTYHADFWEPIV